LALALSSLFFDALGAGGGASNSAAHTLQSTRRLDYCLAPMPSNKPFFPNLRPVKKVVTPQGEILIRKECKCGNEIMGPETQKQCEKCLEKKSKRK
jgi:hypothetical protein